MYQVYKVCLLYSEFLEFQKLHIFLIFTVVLQTYSEFKNLAICLIKRLNFDKLLFSLVSSARQHLQPLFPLSWRKKLDDRFLRPTVIHTLTYRVMWYLTKIWVFSLFAKNEHFWVVIIFSLEIELIWAKTRKSDKNTQNNTCQSISGKIIKLYPPK